MAEWVAAGLREMAGPDEFGRVFPFAVYVYYPETGRELVHRNLRLADAERLADEVSAGRPGVRVHVSVDACG
jgi:hypothetical protein